MAKASIHIWHDAAGRIIAIGRPRSNRDSARKVVPIAGKNQFVLETEVDEAHIKTLSGTHAVDVQKKTLVEVGHRR